MSATERFVAMKMGAPPEGSGVRLVNGGRGLEFGPMSHEQAEKRLAQITGGR